MAVVASHRNPINAPPALPPQFLQINSNIILHYATYLTNRPFQLKISDRNLNPISALSSSPTNPFPLIHIHIVYRAFQDELQIF